MDPLTQGVLGVVATQQCAKPRALWAASVLGFFSGMAADLDVILRSSTDPLLALEFHRQFTHSLLFIPFGGLLCALFFYVIFKSLIRKADFTFKHVWLYCTIGYATHGLLDACTTYGTQLLWPLSNMRVAWNTISIIDPLLTIPLLALVVVAIKRHSKRFSMGALCWLIVYSLLGVMQRERAESFAWDVAKQRGHHPIRLEAKPSFANLLVWKVVYTTQTHFYVDAVRVGLKTRLYQGSSVARLDIHRDFPWMNLESQQAKDIERFRWFSNDYLALSRHHKNRVIDVRYSLLPNEIKGLWGIELSEQAQSHDHVTYVTSRDRSQKVIVALWNMIVGKE